MSPNRICLALLLPGLLLGAGPAGAAVLLVPEEFATIQAAVDAASPAGGDEIVVGAGIFEEQVVIDRDVTIAGAGVGQTILRAPVFMERVIRPVAYNPVVLATSPLGQIVLRDFTIDGAGRGRSGTRFTGIAFSKCGGLIEQVDIQAVHEQTLTNFSSGIGIYVFSEPGDGVQLTVQDVNVTDYQKAGFVCFGSGCDFDLRRVTVDPGDYHDETVQNGFELLNGSHGTITDCTARMCRYDGTYFAGIVSCGFLFYYGQGWTVTGSVSDQNQSGIYGLATDLEVRDCEVIAYPLELDYSYGIVCTGQSPVRVDQADLARPVPLSEQDLGPELALGKSALIEDCSIRGSQLAGSIGLLAMSGLGENNLTLSNSHITGWDLGILTYETAGQVIATARTCRLQDNLSHAIFSPVRIPFDARGNFWGDPTGPFHPELNPGGLGDQISDNVIFDPWLQGNVVCGPVPRYVALADEDGSGYSGELSVRYIGGAEEPVYGFSTEITWDQDKLTIGPDDFSRPDDGVFQNAVLFQVLPITGGYRIEAALGGAQPGIDAGELFTVRVHLVGQPAYLEIPLNLTVRHLRDNQNQEINGVEASGGLVIADLAPPQFTLLKLTNTSLPHTNAFAKNGDLVALEAGIAEDDPLFDQTHILGDFIYLFGVQGYERIPDVFQDDTAFWSEIPAELYPADGPVEFRIVAADPAGNTATVTGAVIADNTAPLPVDGLEVTAGHNRIALRWDEPTGLDINLRQVVVRANRTFRYPLYDAPEPDYPATPTAGEPVYSGLDTTSLAVFPADGSERDLFSFQAFAVDQVGLVSPAGTGSRDRAANYLAADVSAAGAPGYDGITDIFDLTWLGSTFWLTSAETGFNAECDVGPTTDGTVSGLPLPDGVIDLDDLMVFADRFEPDGPVAAEAPMQPEARTVHLTWSRQADDLWVLQLDRPCRRLKGLRLRGSLPAGVTARVQAGELLQDQAAPHLLLADTGRLDACLAMLGAGTGVRGTGHLLRVTTSRPLTRLAVDIQARSVTNSDLATGRHEEPEPLPTPVDFALHGNFPNPFNAATIIAFDLPAEQQVRLDIYTLDGRRVCRLLNTRLPAGRHEVSWSGWDDRQQAVAAGVYLYRLEAGARSAAGKLNLVK